MEKWGIVQLDELMGWSYQISVHFDEPLGWRYQTLVNFDALISEKL